MFGFFGWFSTQIYIGKSSPQLLINFVWGCYELFANILKQEQWADRLGYLGVIIPEHPSIKIVVKAHFNNYLMSDYIAVINYASM